MKGKVYLVGGGPGDYQLITLKGLVCIRQADVLIYDRLVNPYFLKEVKLTCETIYVGKDATYHTLPQAKINQLLVEKARAGKIVTRLKGGDPYVFGRGGEEAEYLYDHHVPFEVVPGITSAIGGLCYGGIPITHRDYASSFQVITGHLQDHQLDQLDWSGLARHSGTLVFLMGVKNLAQISASLIREGMSQDTPVALISRATTPTQQVLTSTLVAVQELALKEAVKPPTLIVVGKVVQLRNKLNFVERKPLYGKNIVITRSSSQNRNMVEKIMDLGGNPIEIPTIKIEKIPHNTELEHEIKMLKKYQYLILTSTNGVTIFFEALTKMGLDSRALAHLKIATIGSKTAQVLSEKGIKADLVPTDHTLEALVQLLKPFIKPSDRILIPKAKKTRTVLVENLPGTVKEVAIYETLVNHRLKALLLQLLDENMVDYLTFSSASSVQNFMKMLGQEQVAKLRDTKIISIGPMTTQAILAAHLKLYKEAEIATIDAIIKAIEKDQIGD